MKSMVLFVWVTACLILLTMAMPAAAAENFERACERSRIENSFKQIGLKEDKINELQNYLKAGDYMNGTATGKLDNRTYKGLVKFCLEIEPQEKTIPLTDPQNLNGDLANFLIAKLNLPSTKNPEGKKEGKDSPMPCEIPSIEGAFKKLTGKKPAIENIQAVLKAGGYLTDRVDGELGPETYNALTRLCGYLEGAGLLQTASDEDKTAADVLFKQLTGDGLKDTKSLLQEQTSLISLTATGGCGCSRDFDARVYGFLPYWLADGTPQTVDFSMLDRIGFHALRLDADGKISNGSLWSKGSKSKSHIAKFISTAHRHRVKVDITFYMSNWMQWKGENGKQKIGNAVEAIENSINQEFSDTSDDEDISANLVSLLRKMLPFVEDNSIVHADGINLYFDNYEKPEYAPQLISIVEALAAKMPGAKFNVMLGLNWAGINKIIDGDRHVELRGINKQLFTDLKPILEDVAKTDANTDSDSDANSDSVAGRVENLFVFLPRNTDAIPENTSNSKKLLRRTIEAAFDGDGETRRTVLRKTIPIVPTSLDAVIPHYFDEKYRGKAGKFIDDLIYLQDNFAGVGLWPLPMELQSDDAKDEASEGDESATEPKADEPAESHAKAIGDRLEDIYVIKADSNLLPEEVGRLTQMLCDFACPNRWIFRVAFDFLAALIVIYWLLALYYCRLREIYQRRFLYFFAYGIVTAMIFSVSLVCDPSRKEISDYVVIAILLALIGIIGIRYIGELKRKKMP